MTLDKYRINEAIRVSQVRLIDDEGQQIGVIPIGEALQYAEDRDLDLVEVAPQAKPPVCKLMDFGRFKYQQAKRQQQSRKKQRTGDLKEVKIRPKISDHDINFKLKKAEEFLSSGHKVKAVLMFRGREMAHPEIGQKVLNRFLESLAGVGQIDSGPKQEGRFLVAVLSPRSGGKAKEG